MHGCVGAVRLLLGYYLVVLTSCSFVEHILGCAVFKATDFGIIRCSAPGLFHALSRQHRRDEARYLHLLRASLVENSKHLYFAYGHDISRNCQSQYLLCRPWCSIRTYFNQNPSRDKAKCKSVSLLTPDGMLASDADGGSECNKSMTVTAHQLQNDSWYLADKRFCWNRCAGEMLDDITLPTNRSRRSIRALLLPLICGSFGCFRDSQGDTSLSLVARTSVSRFGIRHYCRGSNTEGEVANFVETEQIVCVQQRYLSSFVMVRGSVPLKWSQPLRDLSWNQKISFNSSGNISSTRRHFAKLVSHYGHVKVVDLLSSRGEEGMLKQAFLRSVSLLPPSNHPSAHVQYFHFDLHEEMTNSNTAALERLASWTKAESSDLGQFMFVSGREESGCQMNLQNGVFRVNCKDCLDRTNLVQRIIACSVLQQQLHAVAIIDSDFSKRCKEAHRVLWADHGDRISSQYAGTLALRRDLTRTGNRTLGGLLQDAKTALNRYFRAKFLDGSAQDSLDLWTTGYLPGMEDAPLRSARFE